MVNYQLYHTNIALGGQLKWDIVVSDSPQGLIVTNFGLSPISRNITYNPKPVNDLLNYSHTDNLITYYKEMADRFWDNGEDPVLKGDWPVITNEPKDTHYGCIELGCRRGKYSTYERQFEFLVPCWLEHLGKEDGQQAVLQFTIYLCSKNQVIAVKTLELEYKRGCKIHNRFVKYFLDYADKVGINGDGNDKVLQVNLSKHKAFVMGTDLKSGEFTKRDISLSLISNILRRERPLMDVDGMLIDSLANNHIIAPQLFNFCIHFNASELLSSALTEKVYSKGFNFRIRTSIQRRPASSAVDGSEGIFEKLPLRDIYTNYDFIPRHLTSIIDLNKYKEYKSIEDTDITDEYLDNVLDYVEEDFERPTFIKDPTDDDIYSRTEVENVAMESSGGIKSSYTFGSGLIKKVSEQDRNVLGYMQDNKYVGTISKNRICQRICHWSIYDNPGHIFNLYGGFGNIIDLGGILKPQEDGSYVFDTDYIVRAHFQQDTPNIWNKTYSPSAANLTWLPTCFIDAIDFQNSLARNYRATEYEAAFSIAQLPDTWGNGIRRNYKFNQDSSFPYKYLILTPPNYTIQKSLIERSRNIEPIYNYPAYRYIDDKFENQMENWCPFWTPADERFAEVVGSKYLRQFRSFDPQYASSLLTKIIYAINVVLDGLNKEIEKIRLDLLTTDKSTNPDTYDRLEKELQKYETNFNLALDDAERFLNALCVNIEDSNRYEAWCEWYEDLLTNVNDPTSLDTSDFYAFTGDPRLLISVPQSNLSLVVLTSSLLPSKEVDQYNYTVYFPESNTPNAARTLNSAWLDAVDHLSFANVQVCVRNFYYMYNALFAILSGHYEDGKLVESVFANLFNPNMSQNEIFGITPNINYDTYDVDNPYVELYSGYVREAYMMNPLSYLYHFICDIDEPEVVTFNKTLTVSPADAPSIKTDEVEYYKNDDGNPTELFMVRYDGYLKPTFIAPNDTYKNYKYFKEQLATKENKFNIPLLADSAYAKYTPTKHIPTFPSLDYYAIHSTDIVYTPDANDLDSVPWFVHLNQYEYNWFLVGWHYLLRPKLAFILRQTIDNDPKKIKEMVVSYIKELYDLDDDLALYITDCYNIRSSYDYVDKVREITDKDGNITTQRYTDLNDYVYRLNLVLK